MNILDLAGQTYGRLLVLSEHPIKRGKDRQWLCRCSCGTEKVVCQSDLRKGSTVSCGCYREEFRGTPQRTHGMVDTPEYKVWHGMRQRCSNPHNASYERYGGRGITVCERWQFFANFYVDMGPRPEGMSLGRIDNDGLYSPENCRWATPSQQQSNTHQSVIITYDGRTMSLMEWANYLGKPWAALRERLKHGWSIERTLTEPLHPHVRKSRLVAS